MKINKPDIIEGRDLKLDDYSTHYAVNTYCKNCGKHDSVRVRRGLLKKGLSIVCENCGCKINL